MPMIEDLAEKLTRRQVLRGVGIAALGGALLPVIQASAKQAGTATPSAQCAPAPTHGTPAAGEAMGTAAAGEYATGTAKAGEYGTPSAAAGCLDYTVDMNDQLKFVPEHLTIKKGDMVTWVTVGVVPHTATDDPSKASNKADSILPEGAKPWDSGVLAQGEKYSHTFDVVGEYTYFCIPHEAAGMIGTITVEE